MPNPPVFSQIFGRSPISPIQAHIKVAAEAVAKLPEYFEKLQADDWEGAAAVSAEIADLEQQADEIKRNIRSNLPRSLFMPFPRSDLLELLGVQDKMPNRAKDIAGLMLGRKMQLPKDLEPLMGSFIQKSAEAAAFAVKALNELDELIETGFSGREVDLISDMITKLNVVESETDELQSKVQHALYGMEKDLNPIDVIFMYRVIEWVGDIADNAQAVGNRMLYLIAK